MKIRSGLKPNEETNLSIYDLVSTNDGYVEIQKYFSVLLSIPKENLKSKKIGFLQINSILGEIFIKHTEEGVSTLCDLLDVDLNNGLDVNQVYLVIAFGAAFESGQMIEYLHKFGRMLFSCLSSKSKYLVYERMIRFVCLFLDQTSVEIQRMLQRIGVDRGEKIYFEEFELFLYKIFKEVDDEERFKRVYVIMDNNSKKTRVINVAGSKKNDKHSSSNYGLYKCNLI